MHYKCPFNLIFHDVPDYSIMKTFGCLVFTCSTKRNKTKLDFRSYNCVYLGIKHGIKGHILYDIHHKTSSFPVILFSFIISSITLLKNPNPISFLNLLTLLFLDLDYDYAFHPPPTSQTDINPSTTNSPTNFNHYTPHSPHSPVTNPPLTMHTDQLLP